MFSLSDIDKYLINVLVFLYKNQKLNELISPHRYLTDLIVYRTPLHISILNKFNRLNHLCKTRDESHTIRNIFSVHQIVDPLG